LRPLPKAEAKTDPISYTAIHKVLPSRADVPRSKQRDQAPTRSAQIKMNTDKLRTATKLIVLGIFALTTGCSGLQDPEKTLERARVFLSEGKYASAEIELRNTLKAEPQNREAINLLGKVFSKQGRLRDTFSLLSKAKERDMLDAQSYVNLGSVQASIGMPEEAMKNAQAALEMESENAEALILAASLSAATDSVASVQEQIDALPDSAAVQVSEAIQSIHGKDLERALSQIEEALEIDPGFSRAHELRLQITLATNPQEAKKLLAESADYLPKRSAVQIAFAEFLEQTEGVEAAISHYESVLEEAPDYMPLLTNLAALKAKNKDYEEAKLLASKALRLDRIDLPSLRTYGAIQLAEGKLEESIKTFEQALSLYPNDALLNFQAALAYSSKQDPFSARARLNQVLRVVPDHFQATAMLTSLQSEDKDYTGAIITVETYLKNVPNSVEAKLLLAEVHNQKGDSEAAVEIYDELASEGSNPSHLDYLSGVSYLRDERPEKARRSFEQALQSNPMHLQSVEQLTSLDLRESNFQSALLRIEDAIDTSPENSTLHSIRANILQRSGDFDNAKKSYQTAIRLNGENRAARIFYARMLNSQGEVEAALAQYNALLERNPNDLGALNASASIQEASENFEAAIDLYKRALEADEANVWALNNLAYIYSTEYDELEESFAMAQRARDLVPGNPSVASTLGWIVHRRGDYEWALSLIQDAYTRLRGNAEVAYNLGATHYAIGNRESATKFLRESVDSADSYNGLVDAKLLLDILEINVDQATAAQIKKVEERVATHPEDSFALAVLARHQYNAGSSQRADSLFSRALEASPNNLEAKAGIAEILSKDPSNAQRVYSLAAEIREFDSENSFAQALQGIALNQQGQSDLAKSQLKRVQLDELPTSLRQRVQEIQSQH